MLLKKISNFIQNNLKKLNKLFETITTKLQSSTKNI